MVSEVVRAIAPSCQLWMSERKVRSFSGPAHVRMDASLWGMGFTTLINWVEKPFLMTVSSWS